MAFSWSNIVKTQPAAAPAPEVAGPRKEVRTAIVDTNAIISGLHLEGLAERYVTIPEVLREIKDKNARNFLSTLPYELKVLEPSEESVRIVNRFAQETGDAHCLSAVDMRLLALARTLEVEFYGASKLRNRPAQVHTRARMASGSARNHLPGWGAGAVDDEEGWREVDAIPDHVLSSAAPGDQNASRIRSAGIGLLDDLDESQAANNPSASLTTVAEEAAPAPEPAVAVPSPASTLKKTEEPAKAKEAVAVEAVAADLKAKAKLSNSTDAAAAASGAGAEDDDEPLPCLGQSLPADGEDDGDWEVAGSSKNAERRRRRKTHRRQERSANQWAAEEKAEAELAEAKQQPEEPKEAVEVKEEAEEDDDAEEQEEQSEEEENEEEEQSEEEEDDEEEEVEWVQGESVDGGVLAQDCEFIDSAEGQATEGKKLEKGCADEDAAAASSSSSSSASSTAPADGGAAVAAAMVAKEEKGGASSKKVVEDDAVLLNTTSCVFSVTADFAMQNVLLQMGLRLITKDGRQIKRVTRWALRCTACAAVTGEIGRVFCPRCGNMTLERVEVNVGPDGAVLYGVRKKHVLRGTRYSLPRPKGGRGARRNPILCEDEMIMKLGRKARNKMAKANKALEAEDPMQAVADAGGFASQSWQQFALGKGRDAALQITNWKNNPNERKNVRTNRRR